NLFAWSGRASALFGGGKYDDALDAYNNALVAGSSYKEIWLGKGDVLTSLGRYPEALYAYDRALAIDPDYNSALRNRTALVRTNHQYLLISPVHENMNWVLSRSTGIFREIPPTPPENRPSCGA
ncbi:MAG: tetratricopeptide repeat protein, partial [Methanoregula sp.]|nr:tetratricopeptide repeat protein [Methanoregula sp.]